MIILILVRLVPLTGEPLVLMQVVLSVSGIKGTSRSFSRQLGSHHKVNYNCVCNECKVGPIISSTRFKVEGYHTELNFCSSSILQ